MSPTVRTTLRFWILLVVVFAAIALSDPKTCDDTKGRMPYREMQRTLNMTGD